MIELLKNLNGANIMYIIVNLLMISGILYVSIYSVVFSNEKIVSMIYADKPTLMLNKDDAISNIPEKEIKEQVKEKVTFFIGMLFSAFGALLQCVLDLEKVEASGQFLCLMLVLLLVATVIIYIVVEIIAGFKVKKIVKLMKEKKLMPKVSTLFREVD